MKSLLTIQIDTALWATVTQALKGCELGRLMKALAALMNGDDPMEHINTSGLKLAFALLSEPLSMSVTRLERNRINGAKGGRPRKQSTRVTGPQGLAPDAETTSENQVVTLKKTKKEDLPPTPPIEEKNKKNNSAVVDVEDRALAREQFKKEALNNDLRTEQACPSLHIDPGEYRRLVGEVLNDWEFADEQDWSYKHLLNTLRIKVRNQSKPLHHETRSKNRRDITDTTATSAQDYEGPF